MIPESFVQELLGRIDIVDVVERYVPLRKAGINYSACCPFHSEKTPSFTVSPSKQFYHCFGCGAHGSAISFLMQHAGIGFVDAVEELAGSVGLQVPQETTRRAEHARKAPLTELMAQAMRFYRNQLKLAPHAVEYLKGRGLTGEIAARFGMGYAPDDWQGLQQVFPNYNDPDLVECGLVIVNDQGRRYDRFRDRIMFPIFDQRSNVIGFGGRVLGAGEPKYLNSPETPLFEKGRELYGLTQARQGIRDSDTVIVVEGYMDVVALAQHGITNAVATLGTACTPHHVQKLLRQASRVVFCFDGDAAGRKAAWRALEASLEPLSDDKSVGFLFLPSEHDPDSFVRSEGPEEFGRQIKQPTPLTEFLLRELKNPLDLSNAEGRAHLVHEAKQYLTRLSAPILRVQLTKAIAEAAAMTQAEVEAQCGLKPPMRGRPPPPPRKRPTPRSIDHALLEIIARRPEWSARVPLELIDSEQLEGAALLAIAHATEHGEMPAGGFGILLEFFRGSIHEPVFSALAASLAEEDDNSESLDEVFTDALDRLRAAAVGREIKALTARAKQGLSTAERQRLTELLAQKHVSAASSDNRPV